jgi:hypothetical protein
MIGEIGGVVVSGMLSQLMNEKEEDKHDGAVRLEVIERKLSKMDPDDPEMPALLKEARALRAEMRKFHLQKQIDDIDNGNDAGGYY